MSKIQLNAYILIVMFSFTIWGAKSAKPVMIAQKPRTNFSRIPIQIGDWMGTEAKFDQATYDALKSCSLLLRYYEGNEGAPIGLAIVYGVDLGDFHQPEFCLEGQGVRSVKKEIVHIRRDDGPQFEAVSLIMESDYNRQAFVYWFSSKGRTAISLGSYKTRMFIDRLRARKIKPSAMIRLSTEVSSTDEEAVDQLVRFAERLSPYLDEEFATGTPSRGIKD